MQSINKIFTGLLLLAIAVVLLAYSSENIVLNSLRKQYVSEIKDEEIGKIKSFHKISETKSKNDYFVINENDESFMVILNKKGDDNKLNTGENFFTHETTSTKGHLELTKMLEKITDNSRSKPKKI